MDREKLSADAPSVPVMAVVTLLLVPINSFLSKVKDISFVFYKKGYTFGCMECFPSLFFGQCNDRNKDLVWFLLRYKPLVRHEFCRLCKPIPTLCESRNQYCGDATENIRNHVRVPTCPTSFDTDGYVVWMIRDGKLGEWSASSMEY